VTGRLVLAALFVAALVLAVAAWAVAGARWLVGAPVRRLRRREELPAGRLVS
jgi:hypothetical protein